MSSAIDYSYHRFATKRFPLPCESQVADLERRIDVRFPHEYRKFLLAYNGGYFSEPDIEAVAPGCPEDALSCLHGIGASHEDAELGTQRRLNLFEHNTPPRILPIGHTIMGGLITLVTQDEDAGVILLKKAFGDFYCLADGIEEFFELLREPTE